MELSLDTQYLLENGGIAAILLGLGSGIVHQLTPYPGTGAATIWLLGVGFILTLTAAIRGRIGDGTEPGPLGKVAGVCLMFVAPALYFAAGVLWLLPEPPYQVSITISPPSMEVLMTVAAAATLIGFFGLVIAVGAKEYRDSDDGGGQQTVPDDPTTILDDTQEET